MGLLDDVLSGLGGKSSAPANAGTSEGGGMSKITMALLALLAYRTLNGKGKLADMLGMNPAGNQPDQTGQTGTAPSSQGPMGSAMGGLSDLLRGSLGGLMGGAAGAGLGTVLNGGLADVVRRLQENGQGQTAQSWVSNEPNQKIAPSDLESALGGDMINHLMQQSGLSRNELLQGLANELPNMVNRLTPNGRLPNDEEASRWLTK